jgi:hypothetical protein
MTKRNRATPHSFDDRIAKEKARVQAQLANIGHGPEREALTVKIRQLDTASHLNQWLTSPGLRSPD